MIECFICLDVFCNEKVYLVNVFIKLLQVDKPSSKGSSIIVFYILADFRLKTNNWREVWLVQMKENLNPTNALAKFVELTLNLMVEVSSVKTASTILYE